MIYFFDSSSLIKRYVKQNGSQEVKEILSKAKQSSVSQICLPEIYSGLNRLKREKIITEKEYLQIDSEVNQNFKDLTVYYLNEDIISNSIEILENNTLRAMDAIHIATAIENEAEFFVTSDERQIKAAEKEQLNVLKV